MSSTRTPGAWCRLFGTAAVVLAAAAGMVARTALPAGADPVPNGAVIGVGAAAALGGATARPAVGITRSPSGYGYWLAHADGSVAAFGDAADLGQATAPDANPLVELVALPSGTGYWLVHRDGSVQARGEAPVLGSALDHVAVTTVVGAASTPTGTGYWLALRDGGVLAFGDARYLGSMAGVPAPSGPVSVVGIVATRSGKGYWLLSRDGSVFAFGDATFAGALPATPRAPVVGMATTPTDQGYWLAAADGTVTAFGDAAPMARPAATGAPVTGVAATADGQGLWLATGGRSLGTFTVTCYALRGRTASGRPVGATSLAVDRRVVPMGTEVFVANDGYRVASDTGRNIRGRRLDIWRRSSAECRQFGRQTLAAYAMG